MGKGPRRGLLSDGLVTVRNDRLVTVLGLDDGVGTCGHPRLAKTELPRVLRRGVLARANARVVAALGAVRGLGEADGHFVSFVRSGLADR